VDFFMRVLTRIFKRIIPDWRDAEDVRKFVLKIHPGLGTLAEMTSTKLDDRLVKALGRIAASQEVWLEFYGLFVMDDAGCLLSMSAVGDPTTIRVASDAGVEALDVNNLANFIVGLTEN